jgi:hypothetical protein
METLIVQILFVVAAVLAALDANGDNAVKRAAPRIVSLATAACLAFTAFYLQVTNLLPK